MIENTDFYLELKIRYELSLQENEWTELKVNSSVHQNFDYITSIILTDWTDFLKAARFPLF